VNGTIAGTSTISGKLGSTIQSETDTYLTPRSTKTLLVVGGSGATFYPVVKIPAIAGNSSGAYEFTIGIQPPSGTAILAISGDVYQETNNTCGFTIKTGRYSSQFSNVRIQQVTSDGSHVLEFQITGLATDAAYTIVVKPTKATYDASAVPVAVQNGAHAAGTSLLGSIPLSSQKLIIADTGGAQIEHFKDGSTNYFGNRLVNIVGQIDNAERLHMWNPLGIGAMCTSNPLNSVFGAASTCHIDVAACTFRRGGSTHDMSFNNVNNVVTGLASGAAGRYVFADITDNTGGTKAWSGSTSATTACNGDNRVCLGLSAVMPAAGTTTGGAGNVPNTSCVAPEMWIDGDRQAKDLRWGSKVICSNGKAYRVRPTVDEFFSHLWRLCTGRWNRLFMPDIYMVGRCRIIAPGVEWIGSAGTPFDLMDGSSVIAGMMYRRHVLKPSGSWCQVTEVESLDLGPVVRIHLGGRSYPAGLTPELRCFSHNPYKP
jgi:hypothetical protein